MTVPVARSLSLDELRLRLAAGSDIFLLDVREVHEFARGALPGALNLPLSELATGWPSIAPDALVPVIVYCASGTRASRAAEWIASLGRTDVEVLLPGYDAWLERGEASGTAAPLNAEQRERYARHLVLDEVGELGQAKLLASRVLVVGAGGLGSPVLLYLAAAGVGTLGIADGDVVEVSNLQRQIVHATARIGMPKVESARAAIAAHSPDTRVLTFGERVDASNVARLVGGYDVVVDGTDNFTVRYLLNDACAQAGVPLVHGSIHRFEGQVTTFVPQRGPCYRCLYPSPPPRGLAPSCGSVGVLGVLPGVIGTLQATEVLKLLLGCGRTLEGRLITYDALALAFRELTFERDPGCVACGDVSSGA